VEKAPVCFRAGLEALPSPIFWESPDPRKWEMSTSSPVVWRAVTYHRTEVQWLCICRLRRRSHFVVHLRSVKRKIRRRLQTYTPAMRGV